MTVTTNPLAWGISSLWTADRVAGAVGVFMTDASKMAGGFISKIDQTIDGIEDLIDQSLRNPGYDAQTGEIVWTFNAPSGEFLWPDYSGLIPALPGSPTEPDRPVLPPQGPLMTAAQSQTIYDRDRARVAVDGAGLARQAIYQAASFGIGLPTPVLVAGLREAREKSAEAGLKVSADQAAQEAMATREDIAKIIGFELQQYQQVMASGMSIATFLQEQYKDRSENIWKRLAQQEENVKTQIAAYEVRLRAETERRGWTTAHVEMLLRKAKDGADINMQWALSNINRLIAMREHILSVYAQMAQALLQMSDASLGFSGSQSISTSGNASN